LVVADIKLNAIKASTTKIIISKTKTLVVADIKLNAIKASTTEIIII